MKPLDERLFYAIINRDMATVRKSLEAGADVNARDYSGQTPLHLACWYGDPDVALLLIQKGADVNARGTDEHHDTPLHAACVRGYTAIARLLLSHGADVNARNGFDTVPLHWACRGDHFEVTKFLLENGADVDARDHKGRLPLGYAPSLPSDAISRASREQILDLFRQYAPEQVMEAYCTDNASQHTGMGL